MLRRDSLACGTTQKYLFVVRKMKKLKIVCVNPIAKAMLGQRKSPQVVPPKKGKKKPYRRTRFDVRSESYE